MTETNLWEVCDLVVAQVEMPEARRDSKSGKNIGAVDRVALEGERLEPCELVLRHSPSAWDSARTSTMMGGK